MNKSETKQDNKGRTSAIANLSWSVAALLAIAALSLLYVQAITGIFNPLSEGGGKVSQWCQPGSSKRIESPHFSADGSKFVLTLGGACKIGVYTIDTESVVYLTPPKDSAVFGATFGPRNATIAFILSQQVGTEFIDYQLAVSQIDGSGLRVLTSSDTLKRFPAFSFDGTKVIFEGHQRCKGTPAKYCWSDMYEYDFLSNKETRISHLQPLQIGPAYFLPGNKKIVTPIVGAFHPEGLADVPVEAKYGSERGVFIVDANNATDYEQLALDTPTASSPKPLPSGEIAFVSRVNEYENIKGSYIYDVFLWSNGVSRRLTQSNRFIRDYAITDTGKSVLLVTQAEDSQCGLMLWNVSQRTGRKLKCDDSVSELPLTP